MGIKRFVVGFFTKLFNSLVFFKLCLSRKIRELGPDKVVKFPGPFQVFFTGWGLWITPSFFLTLPDGFITLCRLNRK